MQIMYRLMDLLSNSTITYKEIYFDNHEKLLGHESAFVKFLHLAYSNKQRIIPFYIMQSHQFRVYILVMDSNSARYFLCQVC